MKHCTTAGAPTGAPGSIALLALTVLGGCSLFGGGNATLAQVDELLAWVERVHVDAELSKQQVRAALKKLQVMVAPDFRGDAVAAHAELTAEIERSRQQAADLRASFEAMQRVAQPVFEQWQTDLDTFHSPSMRQRSEARLLAARQRYDAIVAAAEPAVLAYDSLNLSLHDHALFLGYDFNADSVAALAGDVQALVDLALRLDRSLDASLAAARGYVESAALPMRLERSRTAEQQAGPQRGATGPAAGPSLGR